MHVSLFLYSYPPMPQPGYPPYPTNASSMPYPVDTNTAPYPTGIVPPYPMGKFCFFIFTQKIYINNETCYNLNKSAGPHGPPDVNPPSYEQVLSAEQYQKQSPYNPNFGAQ